MIVQDDFDRGIARVGCVEFLDVSGGDNPRINGAQ
jgi:hypothetical protein